MPATVITVSLLALCQSAALAMPASENPGRADLIGLCTYLSINENSGELWGTMGTPVITAQSVAYYVCATVIMSNTLNTDDRRQRDRDSLIPNSTYSDSRRAMSVHV